MDLEQILSTIQPFIALFVALFAAFLTAIWVSAVIWAFRDIRSRTRDIFAQILATLMVLIFFPLFPLPGLILYLILRPRETLAEIYERSLEEEALLQGIEERLACPGCNRSIAEDYVVCPSCHTRLKKPCVSCGRLLHLSWTICAYCGAAQTTAQAAVPAPQQPFAIAGDGAEPSRLAAPAPSSLPEPATEASLEEGAEPSMEAQAASHAAVAEEVSQAVDEIDTGIESEVAEEAESGEAGDKEAASEPPLEPEARWESEPAPMTEGGEEPVEIEQAAEAEAASYAAVEPESEEEEEEEATGVESA